MKRYRLIYTIVAAALISLAACQSDEDVQQGGEEPTPAPVEPVKYKVGVRISPAGGFGASSTTRAWKDTNADNAEMMNLWTIVVTDADGNVKAIHASKPSVGSDTDDNEQEYDVQNQIDDVFNLSAGTYKFYSFANMAPSAVFSVLGISATPNSNTPSPARTRADGDDPTDGNGNNEPSGGNDNETNQRTVPTTDPFYENPAYGNDNVSFNSGSASGGFDDPILSDNTVPKGVIVDYTPADGATVSDMPNKNLSVSARGLDPTNVGTTANIYGVKGIPMTNVQTITVGGDTNIDLVVVRVYAKIELQLYNETGSGITIKSVKFSDITRSVNDNYKLLPKTTDDKEITSEETSESTQHGYIKDNLNTGIPGRSVFHYTPSSPITVGSGVKVDTKTPVSVTFYINESSAPQNLFGKFFFALEVDKDGSSSEYRYAMISGTNQTGKTGSWDYIARNDYRIIPVVLDDYKLDLIPYDFPAIGVYPASVKEEDGLYTINFHDYGHFHLVPTVTKMSDNSVVPFTATAPITTPYASTSWGLVGNDFTSSWATWTSPAKETEGAGGFYRTGTYSYITTATDGDEVGGAPVWYANTSAPQWDPKGGTTFNPYIFGYIADPGGAFTEDKSVYHEFTISLYKQGASAARLMQGRVLMILDTNQMMYARHRSAPRRAHATTQLPHNYIWK